jgi:hypothetical protein
MREYTLKVARIRNAGKGQYDVCIDIIDDEKQTSAPYKIVKVDAINEDIAVKKANIILEEMFYSEETLLDIQSMYGQHLLEYVKSNHIKNYSSLAIELDRLRTKYEDELTAFVKNAQISETEGIDVEDLEIYVDLDGRAELLVEAIRVCNDEQWDNMVELFVPDDEGEMVWMSIYDFYPDTAIKILTALMENE